jgi:hypothetical protein
MKRRAVAKFFSKCVERESEREREPEGEREREREGGEREREFQMSQGVQVWATFPLLLLYTFLPNLWLKG